MSVASSPVKSPLNFQNLYENRGWSASMKPHVHPGDFQTALSLASEAATCV